MNDMRATIIPKSDQINADDLIAGPLTITVASVAIRAGQEQPVSINFDGDNGKPYKPCKSMCKVLVHLWGPDANAYVGRSMTLYRDPKVLWGGMAVGGIRISHLSHIEATETMMLTETRKARKPFTVNPLVAAPKPATSSAPSFGNRVDRVIAALPTAATPDALARAQTKSAALLNELEQAGRMDLRDRLLEAFSEAGARLAAGQADDVFPGDAP